MTDSEKDAEIVYQAKLLKQVRDRFTLIIHDIEDEGDRVYFGSSNHADDLRDTVEQLDDWDWHRIDKASKGRDLYADLRAVRELNRELVVVLGTVRDYVSDVVEGGLVLADGSQFLNDNEMPREDLARIDAAIEKASPTRLTAAERGRG